MEQPRKISELLQIILNNINNQHNFTGICSLIWGLESFKVLTMKEYIKVNNYLNSSWRFYIFKYWWPIGWKLPRRLWLQRHIFYNKLIGR